MISILFLLLINIISETEEIDISNDTRYLKSQKTTQTYQSKNIQAYIVRLYINKYDLGASERGEDFTTCQDLKKNTIYISTSKTDGNGRTYSVIYFVDLQSHSFHIIHSFINKYHTMFRNIYCSSEILIITVTDNRSVYAINRTNNDIFNWEVGYVVEVLFDENNHNNVAILTAGKKVNQSNYLLYVLDMSKHRWVMISEDVTMAHWYFLILQRNDDILFYLCTFFNK
ncbi:hypothetical protein RF11_04370 [Thelohanellus kitauei]|uniref:Uncharacterized protein n=1 Tax=Thelohanellus kitauei TaxID=669202 RepID=A0A0C2J9E3_THEKT|nr:hypothetical protein RF11_04370 [Thelohanellus kitauei]